MKLLHLLSVSNILDLLTYSCNIYALQDMQQQRCRNLFSSSTTSPPIFSIRLICWMVVMFVCVCAATGRIMLATVPMMLLRIVAIELLT